MTVEEKQKSKWEAIKASREAKEVAENEEEVEYEEEDDEELITEEDEISSLDLIQAVIDNKPGNFTTLFEQLMHGRIAPMVEERKLDIANNLITDQEVIDPDEDEDEDSENEDDDDSDEELDEGGVMPSNAVSPKSEGKKAAAVTDTDHAKNTSAKIHSGRSGNSEKHPYHLKTFSRLKSISNAGKKMSSEEEELTELSAALKKRYAHNAKTDVIKKTEAGFTNKESSKLRKRWETSKKVSKEDEQLPKDSNLDEANKDKKMIKKGHVKGKPGAKVDVDAV